VLFNFFVNVILVERSIYFVCGMLLTDIVRPVSMREEVSLAPAH
jgi:hypothetical protein